MTVNCPRDPLTCRCDYHLGRVEEPGYESTPDGRDGPTVFADRFRPGEGPYNIRPLITYPRLAIEHKATPSLGLHVQKVGRALRPPIVPGVNLDDGEPAPRPSRWRRVARWAGAVAMVVGAVSIMYAEGQAQRAPGVGFGIALGLLMGAALLLGGRDDG